MTASGPSRTAAFFDLDKTIIAKSSTLAFSKPFFDVGLINRRSVLRSAYAQFMFGISGADQDQMEKMRAYLTDLCAGWDVQTVRDIVAETLHSVVDPLVYEEAVALISMHQQAGRDVVIVSASGAEIVEPVGRLLGADRVIATRLVEEDGRYTGEIEFYAYGTGKADAMNALAAEVGYDLASCYAYSDSETDAPMLAAVGHPYAVNPDKTLRRLAETNGWEVLKFARPVALKSRVPLQSTPSRIAAGAFVAGAVTAGVVARQLRKGRASNEDDTE